jgi:hypothetical protein
MYAQLAGLGTPPTPLCPPAYRPTEGLCDDGITTLSPAQAWELNDQINQMNAERTAARLAGWLAIGAGIAVLASGSGFEKAAAIPLIFVGLGWGYRGHF